MNFPTLIVNKKAHELIFEKLRVQEVFRKVGSPVNLLIWAIIVVSLVGFGYALYLNNLPKTNPVLQVQTTNPENTAIDGWNTYLNTKYAYTLKYPPNWHSGCGSSPNTSDSERVCFTLDEGNSGVVVNIKPKLEGLNSLDYVRNNVLTGGLDLKVLNDIKYFSTYDMSVVAGFYSLSASLPHAFFVNNPLDNFIIEIVPEGVSELTLRRIYSSLSFNGAEQTEESIDNGEYSLEKLVDEASSVCPQEGRYTDYQKALATPSEVCRLDLSEQGVPTRKELPSSIGKFVNLKELVLVNNSLLTKLPQELGQLQNLVSLNLTNVPLKEFPSSVTALRKLKYLDWKGHDISRIPGDIDNMTSLVRLVLDGKPAALGAHPEGKLKEVLNDLHNLKSLKHLDLSNNVVSFMPPLIPEMKWLQTLDLRNTDVPRIELEKIKKALSNTKVLF